ncbi:MAG: FAD:protein FMN transferase [Pseudomonadota bacterium]
MNPITPLTQLDVRNATPRVLHLVGVCFFAIIMIIQTASADWREHRDTAMTTDIVLKLWDEPEFDSTRLFADAMREFKRIEKTYSAYREDNPLAYVNQNAARGPVKVDEEMFLLFEQAAQLFKQTQGAFDVTFLSAGYRYDFRASQRPDNVELVELGDLIDFRRVVLDSANKTVAYSADGVRVGFGGLGKGFAVERVAALWRAAGVRFAQISAGGDSRFIGDHNGRPWTIGVQDPRQNDAVAAILPVANEAVSTSGDYQRFFVEDGVRYHHILDPNTGDSARRMRSATVIGPDATLTDGLATGVFVLGLTDGLELIDNTAGFEAVIVDNNGEIHYSSGFSESK